MEMKRSLTELAADLSNIKNGRLETGQAKTSSLRSERKRNEEHGQTHSAPKNICIWEPSRRHSGEKATNLVENTNLHLQKSSKSR